MEPTIVLIAAIQGFLIATALLFKRTLNRAPQVYLALLIFVFALEMLFAWGGSNGFNNRSGVLPFWLLKSYPIIPAALWLFFRHHTKPELKFNVKHLWLFLPAVLDIVCSSIRHFSNGAYLAVDRKIWIMLADQLPAIVTALILAFYSIKIFTTLSPANYTHKSHVLKLLMVLGTFWLITFIWIMETLFNADFHIFFLAFITILFFCLAYVFYFDPAFFELPPVDKPKRVAEFAGYVDAVEIRRLKDMFERDAIYRKPRLTLAQLAQQLNLPVKYTSYLINQCGNDNFNDLVNGYRVKEVIARIPLEKNKTLLGIALDAGFSSKSTFQQVFKQHTGKTPSEFLPGTSGIRFSDL